MSKTKSSAPVIAGLDIGSTKVAIIIGTITPERKIEIVGIGSSPNTGIRQGVVVNIEATTEAIKKAREEAELMSGYKISEVWVGVSGTHIKSFDSKGMVAIKNKEVASQDIERVIEAAKAIAVPSDRSVLHVLPRGFKVDNQDGITDPIGMSGVRLEANVHIVTGGQTALSNIEKCIDKANLKVAGLVLDQLASATAVLSDDEKNLGVCVIDMGGGTCNTLYYVNGSVANTSVIAVGGQHFTHDVAVGLRTPQNSAEDVKKKYGCALSALVNPEETIEVEGVGGRKARVVLKKDLADVIEPRAEETLLMIKEDIDQSGLGNMLGSGIVLTGGASQLEGLIEMGEYVFEFPVRRGTPGKVGGLTEVVNSAQFSTAVGLLIYGLSQTKHINFEKTDDVISETLGETVNDLSKKVKDFFGQIF